MAKVFFHFEDLFKLYWMFHKGQKRGEFMYSDFMA